jgi:hypothetical protein
MGRAGAASGRAARAAGTFARAACSGPSESAFAGGAPSAGENESRQPLWLRAASRPPQPGGSAEARIAAVMHACASLSCSLSLSLSLYVCVCVCVCVSE